MCHGACYGVCRTGLLVAIVHVTWLGVVGIFLCRLQRRRTRTRPTAALLMECKVSALSLLLLLAPTAGVGLISRPSYFRRAVVWYGCGVACFLNIDVRRSTSGRDVRWRASYFVLPVLWSKLRVVWFIS